MSRKTKIETLLNKLDEVMDIRYIDIKLAELKVCDEMFVALLYRKYIKHYFPLPDSLDEPYKVHYMGYMDNRIKKMKRHLEDALFYL